MNNKLYLVSTPIGNYDDITLRALKVLKEADFIICEEYKEARRLLSQYQIEKELIPLNEHNENEAANDILLRIVQGESAALISDCGTPLFSDPGHLLVDLCISQKIDVVPVPGANSLLPALTASGFDFEKFYFYGWLSPKKDERRDELMRLRGLSEVIVLMDTPYRLRPLLSDVQKIFGPSLRVALAYDITMKSEKFYRGTVSQVLETADKKSLKGEFVLIINNRKNRRP
ncbi:MAG: 16S rRNA (cytidine(1402)-2'-O)-methyltransferase [Syntrophomonadaceae bacterium]